jgi:hypothetical protein
MHAREVSATMSAVTKNPQCTARLRNGQRCRMVIESVGAEFCPYHLKLVDEHGADRLKKGALPKERPLRVVAEMELPKARRAAASGEGTVVGADPATVRPKLAEAAAENVEQLKASLLEAALSATTPVWITVECECGKRARVEAPVPDVRARVSAIELLLREGLGRPAAAEEAPTPRLPTSVEAVQNMSWEEMQYVFASLYGDELVAVQRSGGKAAVREKLAALSESERRILREALAQPAPA